MLSLAKDAEAMNKKNLMAVGVAAAVLLLGLTVYAVISISNREVPLPQKSDDPGAVTLTPDISATPEPTATIAPETTPGAEASETPEETPVPTESAQPSDDPAVPSDTPVIPSSAPVAPSDTPVQPSPSFTGNSATWGEEDWDD